METPKSLDLIAVRTADDIAVPVTKPGSFRSNFLTFEAVAIKSGSLAAMTAWPVAARTFASGKIRKFSAHDSARIRFQEASVAISPLPTLPLALTPQAISDADARADPGGRGAWRRACR